MTGRKLWIHRSMKNNYITTNHIILNKIDFSFPNKIDDTNESNNGSENFIVTKAHLKIDISHGNDINLHQHQYYTDVFMNEY